MSDIVPIRRALLSVSDKRGLVELGRALAAAGKYGEALELIRSQRCAELLLPQALRGG